MITRLLTVMASGALLIYCSASAQTDNGPTQITTTDGHTYRNAVVERVDPDGLLVRYEPQPAGLGVAKLKFRSLPDSVRSQYNYDEQKANAYEEQQAKANAQWRAENNAAHSRANWFQNYRALAELNRSLAGDNVVSYSIFLEPNGRVSAQGFTGGVLPYNQSYYPGLLPSPYGVFGSQNGSQNTMPATSGVTPNGNPNPNSQK